MTIRRIVTGRNAAGKSVFLGDGPAPRHELFDHTPGMFATLVWQANPATDPGAAGSTEDITPSTPDWLPLPGGSSLLVVTFPPDSVMMSDAFDPVAAGGEYSVRLPGLAQRFEMEHPGMHQTDTIDYAIVLTGQIALELDDGEQRLLGPGDVVVQHAARHGWRNPTDKPCSMAFAMIGVAT